MFRACEFAFDGQSSRMYGLMLYEFNSKGQSDVAFGNKASIVETRTANRVLPIHHGVNYHATPLEFTIVFGGIRSFDRYEIERIGFWLTGHQDYKWLQIMQADMSHLQYRCLITELTPLSAGDQIYAFQATVKCDCPYAYGLPFEAMYQIADETSITFRNDSSVRDYFRPCLHYIPENGTSQIQIINHSDGDREFLIKDLPASDLDITIDNDKGIITENTFDYNLYDGFNCNFFRLLPGDNELTVTGDGTLTISGRFLHNVAG